MLAHPSCTKCTTFDVNNTESCVSVIIENAYGNSLLSAQFFCKPKVVLKNYLLILKKKGLGNIHIVNSLWLT